jgi:hypothetical protein
MWQPGHFCTVDEKLCDQRAAGGRIPTEVGEGLCNLLKENVDLPGLSFF